MTVLSREICTFDDNFRDSTKNFFWGQSKSILTLSLQRLGSDAALCGNNRPKYSHSNRLFIIDPVAFDQTQQTLFPYWKKNIYLLSWRIKYQTQFLSYFTLIFILTNFFYLKKNCQSTKVRGENVNAKSFVRLVYARHLLDMWWCISFGTKSHLSQRHLRKKNLPRFT